MLTKVQNAKVKLQIARVDAARATLDDARDAMADALQEIAEDLRARFGDGSWTDAQRVLMSRVEDVIAELEIDFEGMLKEAMDGADMLCAETKEEC